VSWRTKKIRKTTSNGPRLRYVVVREHHHKSERATVPHNFIGCGTSFLVGSGAFLSCVVAGPP